MRRLLQVMLTLMALGLACLATTPPAPPPVSGSVMVGAEPVPGASVTASQGSAKYTVLTGSDGMFTFSDLTAGTWTLTVSMTGFETARQTVTVPPAGPVRISIQIAKDTGVPELKTRPVAAPAAANAAAPKGVVAVNGSVDNGAASVYAQSPAFGNARPQGRGLYNGSIGLVLGNSALDARSYSLTGAATPKPSYNDFTGTFQIGGPLIIPHLTNLNNAPFFFVSYQKGSSRNAVTTSALVPTLAERGGDLTAVGGPVIPAGQISKQATALLALYPMPNLTGAGHFNYQAPVFSIQHQDALQTRLQHGFSGMNYVYGTFDMQSQRSDAGSLFGFDDRTGTLGMNSNLNWSHGFTRTLHAIFTLNFSRDRTRLTPFFAGREDVAAAAGIQGGDAAAADWGPPSLTFSSGWAGLSDGLPTNNRNQTVEFSSTGSWIHYDHNLSFGGAYSRLQFNQWEQTNPRGGFTFNGAYSGNDLGDFLLGHADAVSLDYGAADRYLRQTRSYLFVTDDWRTSDSLSLDLGVRWEYEAPITETRGRLANLSVGENFATAAPIVGAHPLAPDRMGIEPRLGLAWEPFAASSVIVRAGYGIYDDTSVYTALAQEMARQAPLDRSLRVAATAAAPLTLATGLLTPAGATATLFGVDPDFRIGYVQTWSASLQRDLPASMVMTVAYLGNKGAHGVQRFLPNSFAPGGVNPCATCPVGFVYETSGGNSRYNAAQATLQRRFRAGVAATLTYTYTHAMDDASVGGAQHSAQFLAQNWRDLGAEWARSSFEQRHKLTLVAQYSTGTRLASGFTGAWLHGWTFTTNITAASGLPLTPVVPVLIGGTGYSGIRPDRTSAPLTTTAAGPHVNPAAFAAPAAGSWGNALRDSITGPSNFDMGASAQRTFPVRGRSTMLFRLDATNVLNHVTYPSWNTTLGSAQFGWPLSANTMRQIRATLRLTF